MGVKEFNKIRDKYGTPIDNSVEFTKIITDASNLIHTYLSASYSELSKRCGKYDFGGIKLDIISQCATIVNDVFDSISKYIYSILRTYPKAEAIFVVDPVNTPNYIVDSGNENIELVYLREIFPNAQLALGTRSLFRVNIKEEEQKKRQGIDMIQQVLDKNSEANDEFKTLVKESMLLGSQHKIIILMEPLLSMLLEKFKNEKKVKFIRAKCEADLLIKNLAYEYKGENVLVKSKDTDYYFLLSEFEWCYCSDLKISSSIYNPNELWNTLLKGKFSYDVVIRLSPILGNDYTTHQNIINSAKDNDITDLLNIDNSFMNLESRRSNSKIKQLYNIAIENGFESDIEDDELTDVSILDELVHIFNAEYFKRYYLSVIIYTEWGFYNEYETLTQMPLKLPNYIINYLDGDKNKMNEQFMMAVMPENDDDDYWSD